MLFRLPEISTRCEKLSTKARRRHIQLEELKMYMTAEGAAHGNFEGIVDFKTFKASKLKRLHIGGGFVSKW